MNELTAKVSEPTALQNPTPTELALLKRLEDCAVVMRGEASSTCDLVWLLSAAEVGFKDNGIPCEGEPYPWYAQGDSAEQRRAVDMDGDEAAYWLRTPYTGHGHIARYVYTDGSLSNGTEDNSYGVLAACVIGSSDSSAPVGASERRDAHE